LNLDNIDSTPIQRISEKINNNNFYMKRDDFIPISFGGNKARKAILFFKEVKKEAADCIVTYGSSTSNHCRIISNVAAAQNIPCYIVSPDEVLKPSFNYDLINLFNAQIIYCSVDKVKETLHNLINNLKKNGYKPYFIQGGGHGNIGTQAYVSAFKEILDYEKKTGINFDYIFHASGTGTTQAGLICGKIINRDNKEVIGISIARKNPYGKKVIMDSVNSYLNRIGMFGINEDNINFIDNYVLDGYGSYNKSILNTIKKVLVNDGIPLDSTYTGKAYWGMTEYIIRKSISNKNILFIHTGGTPLFFNNLGDLK